MAEWWETPDVNFDLFGDSGSAWWDTGAGGSNFDFGNFDFGFDPNAFNFDFNIPDYNFTFDPGQFDLGFDPSFNFDQFQFPDMQFQDPFALPAGDLSLPNLSLGGDQPFDFGQAYAQNGQFNLGDFNPSLMSGFTPTSFPELDFTSLDPGFDMGGAPLAGSNVGTFDQPFSPTLSTGLGATEGLGQAAPGKPSSTVDDQLKEAQLRNLKYAPLLGLGELGLKLGGGLMGALSQPKPRGPSAEEKAHIQAQTDAIRAKMELDKQALAQQAEIARMQAEAAGGGSDTAIEVARINSEAARLNAELQARTAKEIAELNKRHSLFSTDPRFSTLYDQTNAGQQGLDPGNPDIQAMTQQIYAVRQQAAVAQFQKQKDAILERANRLGTNPAAELAQINEAEQQAQQALFVEAQQQALAFAQSRLDPSNELLQAILGTVV